MENKQINYDDFAKFTEDFLTKNYGNGSYIIDLNKLNNLAIEDLINIISLDATDWDWPIYIYVKDIDDDLSFKTLSIKILDKYKNIATALAINYQNEKKKADFYMEEDSYEEGIGLYLDNIFESLSDEYKLLAEIN